MENDRVIILTPDKKLRHYKYHNKNLLPINDIDKFFEKKALAHAIWPTMAYQKRLYRTQDDKLIANK